MKFLIAGGAGSVGQALTRFLLDRGHSVRVLDKKADSLRSLDHKGFELIPGEMEDPSAVRRAVKGVDVIVHLAWSFSDDPMELLASNLTLSPSNARQKLKEAMARCYHSGK